MSAAGADDGPDLRRNSGEGTTIAPILPGAALGVVGGGQLGRYFVLEARRLGYETWVLDPDANAPAMQIAAHPVVAAYDDADALERLGAACAAVTVEFENVPAASLERLAGATRVAPSAAAVQVAQDRRTEKVRAAGFGLSPVAWAAIESAEDVETALERVALPAILKTATLGYDGKGQRVCDTASDVRTGFEAFGGTACVLETRIELQAELSVVLARGFDGEVRAFPPARNVHRNGILATSSVPSGLPDALLEEARSQAVALAAGLDYVGVLGVEFFVDDEGALWFNEMAPRPHNSGHYTLDATVCSQFEQQLRALCALPLGDAALLSPVTMLNVLGDSWAGGAPDWATLLGDAALRLHLYGKAEPRPGRKMGHLNCLAHESDLAERAARVAEEILGVTR